MKSHTCPPNDPCPFCGEKSWLIGKMIDAGGHERFPWWCSACKKRIQVFAGKKERAGLGYEPKLLAVLPRTETPPCCVCGGKPAQQHHWAPSHYFGKECENWPVAHLCQSCHTRWHQIVTPGISQS